jgi:hypothetical protein
LAPVATRVALAAHFLLDQDLSEHAVAVVAAELLRVVAAAADVVAPLHARLVVAQVLQHAQPVAKLVLAVHAAAAVPAFAPLAARAVLHVVNLHCVVSARERELAHQLRTPAAQLDLAARL